MRAQVLEQVRDLQARFSVLAELAAAAHQLRIRYFDELQVEAVRAEAGWQRLPVETGQFGLRIEGVDVARTSLHEQVDHALGFGREMRRLGPQRMGGSLKVR